jgi:DEAD/DEAH box helicase domain-containing protein
VDSLLKNTMAVIQGCGFEAGCPSCVQSPKCGSGNRPLDKTTAIFVLEQIKHRNASKSSGICIVTAGTMNI